jgi:hypothetical protein
LSSYFFAARRVIGSANVGTAIFEALDSGVQENVISSSPEA